jgi:hypothetical protein
MLENEAGGEVLPRDMIGKKERRRRQTTTNEIQIEDQDAQASQSRRTTQVYNFEERVTWAKEF